MAVKSCMKKKRDIVDCFSQCDLSNKGLRRAGCHDGREHAERHGEVEGGG